MEGMRMLLVCFCVLPVISGAHVQSKNSPVPLNLHTDPEVYLNTSQLISYHGYPSEEHEVHTKDGYILQIQRIPGPSLASNKPVKANRPVVLLQHGLLSCSACWVENLANESLGFILADAGYDVWLGNNRGNTYGLKHEKLKPDEEEFWAFSWDEMAQHDLPDTIDYILAATGETELFYAGHSQGSMIMLAALSEQHVSADKVKLFAALGPAAYIHHAKSPIVLLAGLPEQTLFSLFGKKDFAPQTDILTWLGSELCSRPLPGFICENILFILGGYDFQYMNQTRIPVYIGHHPAGSSVQNLMHYAQAVRTETFQKYDFGPEINLKKYNTTTPPAYHPEKISNKVALFVGTNDWLTTPEDVARLEKELPNTVAYKTISGWEHLDFIWATNAPQACYDDIQQLFKSV